MKISQLNILIEPVIDGMNKAPFMIIFSGLASGILVRDFIYVSLWIALAGFISASILLLFVRRLGAKIIAVFFIFFFAGVIHLSCTSRLSGRHVFYFYRKISSPYVVLRGQVISDVAVGTGRFCYQMFDFRLDGWIDPEGLSHPIEGVVRVKVFKASRIFSGNRLILSGKLHPPHDFLLSSRLSYKNYLNRRSIFLMLTVSRNNRVEVVNSGNVFDGLGLKIRENLKKRVDKYLSPTEAGMIRALLLGDRTGVSDEIRDLFARTGTAHILAISGLHIGMIAAFFLIVFSFLPVSMKIKYLGVAILIIFYIPLAGGRTSVIRSSIMAAVFLCSYLIERRARSFNALGLSGFIVLWINPFELFSVGFQLSFSAVGSLITFMPQLPVLRTTSWLRTIVEAGKVSFFAWLGVLGWILYYFGVITPLALVVNIVTVFLAAALIVLGFLLLIFDLLGMVCFARLIGLDLALVINLLTRLTVYFERLPGMHFSGIEFNGILCAGYYICLIMAGWVITVKNRKALTRVRAF